MERSGGGAAIVCDTTGNTVRQGYCYTCLTIGGGYFGRVTKPKISETVARFMLGQGCLRTLVGEQFIST